MRIEGFCGPAYESQSPNAAAERCINWYVEYVKKRPVLYPTPGLTLFCTLTDAPLRALFEQDGRCFAVAGVHFFEIKSTGAFTVIGEVASDGKPATICSNGTQGHQLFVVSGGLGYIYDMNSVTFTKIVAAGFPAAAVMGAFLDGYFIVLVANSNIFQISALFDGTMWDPLDKGARSQASDLVVALTVNHSEVWLIGSDATEIWKNTGATNFPFEPLPGTIIQQGIVAPYSVKSVDNTLIWLNQNDRGAGIVFKADGYTPIRISDEGIETAIQGYLRMGQDITGAEAWTYQEDGHEFYVLWFPIPDVTWAWDAATELWHQRSSWRPGAAPRPRNPPGWPGSPMDPGFQAHLGRCHAYAFGKHLVGDRGAFKGSGGNVYRQGLDLYDDNGQPIRRQRRAPHLVDELNAQFHWNFRLDLETGLGLVAGQGNDPTIALSYSNDGGHTFSAQRYKSAGALGNYKTRVYWNRLGRTRDRVYQIDASDPVPWRIFDAYLTMEMGTS